MPVVDPGRIYTSYRGPAGPRGYTGHGAYDYAVMQGFEGSLSEWLDSLVGPIGPDGPIGLTGPQGLPGPQGDPGEMGEKGPPPRVFSTDDLESLVDPELGDLAFVENWLYVFDGVEWQFVAEVRGPAGPAGVQGPEGPLGPEGPPGTGVSILGLLDSDGDLPGSGDPGDAYLIDGDLWVWVENESDWMNVGPIQGPQGIPGPSVWGGISGSISSQLDLAAALSAKANSGALSTVATTGAYSDLTGKPALFPGDYNALTNKPTIPAAQVNSDWNSGSGVSRILNKPTLFDGQYNSLAGRPSIPNELTDLDTTVSGSTLNSMKTKLDGIESGAQTNVNADWNASSGGAQILNKPTIPDQLAGLDTSVTGVQLNAMKTKLDGVGVGATANDTNASLRARSSHTGSQAISTVTNLQTSLDSKSPLISARNGNTVINSSIDSIELTSGTPLEFAQSGVSAGRVNLSVKTGQTSTTVPKGDHSHNPNVTAASPTSLWDATHIVSTAGSPRSQPTTDAYVQGGTLAAGQQVTRLGTFTIPSNGFNWVQIHHYQRGICYFPLEYLTAI